MRSATTWSLGSIPTIDLKTHRLFTVAAKVGPPPERKMEPDSFVVLMLEPGR